MAATYTVRQVAEILGYSTNSIYSFLKAKRIKGVRVGKGRFRIPQSEIDRLLLNRGGKTVTTANVASPKIVNAERAPMVVSETLWPNKGFIIPAFGKLHLSVPSLFDWFIATSAIVSGIALFLFNRTFDAPSYASFLPIVYSARMVLIAAGSGVLLSSLIWEKKNTWHAVFIGVLVAAGSFMTYTLFGGGDIDGMFIYGMLVVVLVISLISSVSDIALLSFYLTGLAIAAPVAIFIAPTDFHIKSALEFMEVSPIVSGLIVSAASLAMIALLWLGYLKNRFVFALVSILYAVTSVCLAFFYAREIYWSRSYFFLTLALVTLFLPVWIHLRLNTHRRTQVATIGLFVGALGILLLSTLGISMVQANLVHTVKESLEDKAIYGSGIVESAISEAQATLKSAASNPLLISAIEENDLSNLSGISRVIYEGTQNIRRLIFLDSEGAGIALYPIGTFDLDNYSGREYFAEVKRTGKPFISNQFVALADNNPRKAVVIATPLVNNKKEFVGVLAGSINLSGLSVRLQKLGSSTRKEYFTLVDSQGNILIDGPLDTIGSLVPKGDPLWAASKGQSGIVEWVNDKGISNVVAYTPVGETGWGISIRSSLSDIAQVSGRASVAVLIILVLVVGFGAVSLFSMASRDESFTRSMENEGGVDSS